jgi:hypothetical protein
MTSLSFLMGDQMNSYSVKNINTPSFCDYCEYRSSAEINQENLDYYLHCCQDITYPNV